MSFDHELIRSLLDSDDIQEYNEDIRERYGNAPVFDMVQELHIELSKMRLTEEELVSTWNEHQELIQLLDVEASKDGLMGQEVSLSGKGIEIPKFETDLTTVAALITLGNIRELDEKSLEKYYAEDEVRGMFSGFTLRFIKTEDEKYVPKVAYQVATDVVDIPHAHINLYTVGLVDTSQLQFEDDIKRERVVPILDRLFSLCEEGASSVNAINMALASMGKYDASRIRHVAYHAEKIVNALDDETLVGSIEDGLVDLISHYIEPNDTIHIKTPFFSMSAEDETRGGEYYQGDDNYALTGEMAGFVFLNQAVVKDATVTYRGRRTLYATLRHEGRYIYTPLTKANEFSRV